MRAPAKKLLVIKEKEKKNYSQLFCDKALFLVIDDLVHF